jgi:hypothetical protein
MTAGRFPMLPAMACPEQMIRRPLRDVSAGLTLHTADYVAREERQA